MREDPGAAAGNDLEAEERVSLRLDGPGMSDLINSAQGRAGYPSNARAMTLSSALRSRRASGKQADSIEIRNIQPPSDKSYQKQYKYSRILSGAPQAVGTPRVSSLSEGLYSQLGPLTKK